MENNSRVSEFTLVGFTDNQQLEILLFIVLFIAYLSTVLGNTLIIVLTIVNQQLHSPMYFFLRHFAVLEIGFTSVMIPKALFNIAMGHKAISVYGCFVQIFVYFALGSTEFFLLAIMSVDRYVAICNPLHYSSIMTEWICSLLVLCCWGGGTLLFMGPAVGLFRMPFCGPSTINHFFCDNGPLIRLACADTTLLEYTYFLTAMILFLGTLAIHVISYAKIISTILGIPSATGRQKAFSTCAAHITVISITYGSCIVLYLRLNKPSEVDYSKVVAVFNTVVSPLLNPFIYCLRNEQFQSSLKDTFRQCITVWKTQQG
ncbi:olfactory receptor 6E1-like [Pogona vitticeps]